MQTPMTLEVLKMESLVVLADDAELDLMVTSTDLQT